MSVRRSQITPAEALETGWTVDIRSFWVLVQPHGHEICTRHGERMHAFLRDFLTFGRYLQLQLCELDMTPSSFPSLPVSASPPLTSHQDPLVVNTQVFDSATHNTDISIAPMVSQVPQPNLSIPTPLPQQAAVAFDFTPQGPTPKTPTSHRPRNARSGINRRAQLGARSIQQASMTSKQQHPAPITANDTQPSFGGPSSSTITPPSLSSASIAAPCPSNAPTAMPGPSTVSTTVPDLPSVSAALSNSSRASTAPPSSSSTSAGLTTVNDFKGEGFEKDMTWSGFEVAYFQNLRRTSFGWANGDATNKKIWLFSTGDALKLVPSENRWKNENNVSAELNKRIPAFKRAMFMLRLQATMKYPAIYTSTEPPLLDEVFHFIDSVIAMTKACGGKGDGIGWNPWVKWSYQFHNDIYSEEKVYVGLRTNYGPPKWKKMSKLWARNNHRWLGGQDDDE